MTETLKKNWFVVVVAVLFLGAAVFFAYDQNKDNIPGRQSDGKDVIFSIGDEYFTADDFYDEFYKSSGPDAAFMLTQRVLLDQLVKTTDDLKKEAQNEADMIYASIYQQYGENTAMVIEMNLTALGLNSLLDYALYNLKLEMIFRDYIAENLDEFYQPFVDEYQPRYASHVLVKMEDVNNPTAEETRRLEEVKEAWNNATISFAEFATIYSEDTGSAVSGGSIGYMDKSSNLVTSFLESALALDDGEVSEWIKSEYGWHLIKVEYIKQEALIAESSFLNNVINANPELNSRVIWARMQEKNISFADPELEKLFRNALGVTDTETDGAE